MFDEVPGGSVGGARVRHAGVVVLAAAAALPLLSCRPAPLPALPASAIPARSVHSAELELAMRDLARLLPERLPKEMNVQEERLRRADALARAARGMAATAASLVDALPVGALGETERRTFTALASRLQWQAEALTERAAGDATPETEARLEEITETCAACHALFRPAPRPD